MDERIPLINGMGLPRAMAAVMLVNKTYKGQRYYDKERELAGKLANALAACGVEWEDYEEYPEYEEED